HDRADRTAADGARGRALQHRTGVILDGVPPPPALFSWTLILDAAADAREGEGRQGSKATYLFHVHSLHRFVISGTSWRRPGNGRTDRTRSKKRPRVSMRWWSAPAQS